MARKVYDRVKEYTASTGIGGISFIGAFTGFQSFDSVFTSGDTTFYVIEEHNQWEVGIGTYGSHNLERDTVLSSSNNGSKINLTGSGVVSVTYPASQVIFADDVVDVSGVAYYASGQAVENELQIASVSGWASSEIDQLYLDDDHVSGIAYYASGQAVLNQGDIASVSGLIGDADFLPGATGALIDQNTQQIASVSGWSQVYADNGDAAVSGWAQSGLDGLDNDLSSVSGWTQSGLDYLTSDLASVSGWTTDNFNTTNSDVDYVSGVASYASGQAIQNESDIVAVSGLIGVADFLPGATGALIDQNTDDIATASGALRNSINTNAADIVTASGSLRDSVNANTADIATASGALRDSINENILDIASVSGLLTPSGTDFTFSNATLTYFNSDGGSFDVDLSSISGDVYAMIVDGAPATLDTLNEIAAALNDDANLANTLTDLITSTSGNLQSQITDNVNNLSSTSGYFETRVDDADAEILAVSGWAGNYANAGDAAVSGWAGTYADAGDTAVSGWSESTFSTLLQTEYVSGIATYASGKSVTGIPSGVLFFDDAGSVTGNSSFIFDGANVTLDGYIDASGERVVTSPDIHHLVQLTQAEYDAITPDSATFYIITDAPSVSGYFEPKVSQNETDIVAVSGIAAYASGNSISGNPSGILFFDDTGAVTGNNSLIFDGQSITLDGTVFATGQRVITSDEIFHIKQLTQAEYDALTPDSATFYIITDAAIEGPVVQPYREVSSNTTILTSDYTINATAGSVLTLPTAVGNGGLMFNIKNTSTGNVIISGVSSQTIDNEPSFEISTQYQSIKVQSTNSNWIIL